MSPEWKVAEPIQWFCLLKVVTGTFPGEHR